MYVTVTFHALLTASFFADKEQISPTEWGSHLLSSSCSIQANIMGEGVAHRSGFRQLKEFFFYYHSCLKG